MIEAGTTYETRSQMDIIMNSGRKPFNYGKSYSGLLIKKSDNTGINCSYLSRSNKSLKRSLTEKTWNI